MGSLFLAKVIGIYLLVIGLMLLIHPKRTKEAMVEIATSKALLTMNGIIVLILGLLIVTSHNQWHTVWQGVISIIGWIALINGVIRLLIPTWGEKMVSKVEGPTFFVISGIVMLILGIYLTYVGYFYTQIITIEF